MTPLDGGGAARFAMEAGALPVPPGRSDPGDEPAQNATTRGSPVDVMAMAGRLVRSPLSPVAAVVQVVPPVSSSTKMAPLGSSRGTNPEGPGGPGGHERGGPGGARSTHEQIGRPVGLVGQRAPRARRGGRRRHGHAG